MGVALGLAFSLAPTAVAAQATDVCSLEGNRVRIRTADEATVTGSLLGCTVEGLQIRPDEGVSGFGSLIDHFVTPNQILDIDVSHGFRKRVLRPVAIGASLVGVIFGGFAYLTGDDGSPCGDEGFCVRLTRKRKTVAGLIAGAAIGAGGGLVHGLTQEIEVWRPWPEVPLARGMTLDVRPVVEVRGALGARFVLRF